MKPGFSFGPFAHAFRLGAALFCLSVLPVAGSAAADDAPATTDQAAPAAGGEATDTSQLPWTKPYIEGNPKARLKITIYFTPYCKECASSYLRVHPLLKKYIDQNLVSVRYQDIYFDEATRRTVALMHCLPEANYLDHLNSLYMLRSSQAATPETVGEWARALMQKYNLKSEFMNTCTNTNHLLGSRQNAKLFAEAYMDIRKNHLPVYVFSKSKFRLNGTSSTEDFDAVLKQILQKKTPANTIQEMPPP